MQKLLVGDVVQVLTGKDKGRTGKILKMSVKKKGRQSKGLWVVVEGVNVMKKHVKANPQLQKPGGIVPTEAAIHASNVQLLNPATNKPSKVGIRTLEDGTKVRFFKSDGEVVDVSK